MNAELDRVLAERRNTHGAFKANAEISQTLKEFIRAVPDLNAVQREALEMIAMKLSRILSGNANVRDHWADLAGYATLGMQACEDRDGG